jgi:hypothetical protein
MRNRRLLRSVEEVVEVLLAVLLALIVPALLTYLPPDV